MATDSKIEGIDELQGFLQNHTKELDKTVIGSLIKGSREIKKDIIANMPGNLQKFKPIVTHKALTKSSNPSLVVGIFGRRLSYTNRRGVKWDPFMLEYWANYGTLANRDKGHLFQSSRREKSKDWRGGIRAQHFFERGTESSVENALKIASEDMDNIIESLSKKFGFQ